VRLPTITGQSLDDGVRGISARVEGFDAVNNIRTTLDIDIIDNESISGNLNDGIRLTAIDGGLIRTNIGNTPGTNPLQIINNGSGGGDGISLLADGAPGIPPAEIQADIDNVFINNDLNLTETTNFNIIGGTDGIAVDGINNSLVDLEVTNSTIGAPNGSAAPIGGMDTDTGIRLNFNNLGSQLINRVNIDNVNFFSEVGIDLFTGPQTFTDFTLANSTLRPTGVQSDEGERSDDDPFVDGSGAFGLIVNTVGDATSTFIPNVFLPNSELVSFTETVSDGVLDNLTQVTLLNNSIQDFTFEGVDINTAGDSQLLLTLIGNDISNNGAGPDNDANNNNVFTGGGGADTVNLFFFDGVDINAFDDSQISATIGGNVFRDNFERGLSLNTFNSATINAVLTNNVFFGNDRGEDVNNTLPPIGVGTASGPTPAIAESGQFDLEAINNEEFFFRPFETLVFTNAAGVPVMLNGMPLPANTIGNFFPGNVGVDINGFQTSLGTAELNLSMSSNSLQLGPEFLDFSVAPGDFTLGLDGLTNGFGPGFFGITDVGLGLAEILVTNEELFFGTQGF